MKKAVWINPVSTGATWLDTSVRAHDVDNIAFSKELEEQGYEVWLQTPPGRVKEQRRPWPNQFQMGDFPRVADADLFIFSMNSFMIDYLGHRWAYEYDERGQRGVNMWLLMKWFKRYEIPSERCVMFIADPRKVFQKIFSPKVHESRDPAVLDEEGEVIPDGHMGREFLRTLGDFGVVVPDEKILDPSLFSGGSPGFGGRRRIIVSDYWKRVDEPIYPWNPGVKEFFMVYPGLNLHNKKRKKSLIDWIDGRENCFTMGPMRLPDIGNISGGVECSHSEVISVTRECTTALVDGEPNHTWLTPRAIQAFTQGTIASIHPDFGGRHWIPDEILEDQTFETSHDFDMKLCTPEIYQRQLDFIRDLRHM